MLDLHTGLKTLIKIYALRGIQNNNLIDLKNRVEEYSKERFPAQVRKTALSVLESM